MVRQRNKRIAFGVVSAEVAFQQIGTRDPETIHLPPLHSIGRDGFERYRRTLFEPSTRNVRGIHQDDLPRSADAAKAVVEPIDRRFEPAVAAQREQA